MEAKQTITEVSGGVTYYGEADLGRAEDSPFWAIRKTEVIAGVTTTKFPIGSNRMPTTKAEFIWDNRASLNFSFEEDATAPTKVSEDLVSLDTANGAFSGSITVSENIAAGTGIISASFVLASDDTTDAGGTITATADGTAEIAVSGTAPNDSVNDIKIKLVIRDTAGNQAIILSGGYTLF